MIFARIRQWWHCLVHGCKPCEWAEDAGEWSRNFGKTTGKVRMALGCTCGKTFWVRNETSRIIWDTMIEELVVPRRKME